jgi:hypothetical protein
MKIIDRDIRLQIEKRLFKGKAIILYGARQVGKTTLSKMIEDKYGPAKYLNCDEIDIRQALENKTSSELKSIIGNHKLVIIDEAQRVKNIGLSVKLIVDNFKDVQILATGSSSFELSNKIKEPLTGRKYEFYLYPFSLSELKSYYSKEEINRILEYRMIFGMYPDIVENNNSEELKMLADSYLYKDVLQHQNIKNPELLLKLLQSLALQVGNQVSYSELASFIGVDKNTITSYINILEKSFIIFKLQPFSRNLRNELKKMRKIYFYDLGIRNALINNFNMLHLREDAGRIFENFMIVERIKFNRNNLIDNNIYFWRTHQQKEIDYLEESAGKLTGFEFKLSKAKESKPKEFLNTYSGSEIKFITKKNYHSFVGIA